MHTGVDDADSACVQAQDSNSAVPDVEVCDDESGTHVLYSMHTESNFVSCHQQELYSHGVFRNKNRTTPGALLNERYRAGKQAWLK